MSESCQTFQFSHLSMPRVTSRPFSRRIEDFNGDNIRINPSLRMDSASGAGFPGSGMCEAGTGGEFTASFTRPPFDRIR